MAKTKEMRRLKGVRHEKVSEDICRCIITMRNPKKQLYIRTRMWWASCKKWEMAMYKNNHLKQPKKD
jgi:hypothetical protein